MKSIVSSLAGVLVACGVIASGNAAEFVFTTLPESVLRIGPSAAPSYVREDTGLSARRRTANIVVTYVGFSAPARAAFQRAIDIWETRVNSAVTIRVRAGFANLGTTGLGLAGPVVFLGCSSCPPGVVRNTWYPVALANKLTRTDNAPGLNDINAWFNTQYYSVWHFGTGPAPAGKFDFTSVALHQLGHGLGFLGAGRLVDANRGSVRAFTPYLPTIYDRFTVNGGNVKLITLADPSAALKTQLTSNNLFFRLSSGTRFKIFAPARFQPELSYSHLNEATFPRGNPNSLMTPYIGRAETIRNPGPVTAQIFTQMGW